MNANEIIVENDLRMFIILFVNTFLHDEKYKLLQVKFYYEKERSYYHWFSL